MAFEIVLHESADQELQQLRVFDQRKIVASIKEQLIHEPTASTRNRKCLGAMVATFEYIPPLWELRVGKFRVFYDVDEVAMRVDVRAIRQKASPKTTEEIL